MFSRKNTASRCSYTITFLSANGGFAPGHHVWCEWKRGSKKENHGSTTRVLVPPNHGGLVMWGGGGASTDSAGASARITCTLFSASASASASSSHPAAAYDQKNIVFVLKHEEPDHKNPSKTKEILDGKAVLDLAAFADLNGLSKTQTLTIRPSSPKKSNKLITVQLAISSQIVDANVDPADVDQTEDYVPSEEGDEDIRSRPRGSVQSGSAASKIDSTQEKMLELENAGSSKKKNKHSRRTSSNTAFKNESLGVYSDKKHHHTRTNSDVFFQNIESLGGDSDELTRFIKKYNKAKHEYGKLSKEMASLNEAMELKDSQIENLKQTMERQSVQTEKLLREIDELESNADEKDTLQQNIVRLTHEIEEMKSLDFEKKKSVEIAVAKKDEEVERAASVKQLLSSAERRCDDLCKQLEAAKLDKARLDDDLGEKSESLAEANEKCADFVHLKEQNSKLQNKIKQLSSSAESRTLLLTTQVDSLSKELEESNLTTNRLEEELRQSRRSLEDASRICANQAEDLVDAGLLKERNSQLGEEVERLATCENRASLLEVQVDDLSKDLEEYRQAKLRLEETLRVSRGSLEVANQKLSALQAATSTQFQDSVLQDQIDSLSKDLEETTAAKFRMEEELRQVKNSLGDLEKLQGQNSQLVSDFAALEASVESRVEHEKTAKLQVEEEVRQVRNRLDAANENCDELVKLKSQNSQLASDFAALEASIDSRVEHEKTAKLQVEEELRQVRNRLDAANENCDELVKLKSQNSQLASDLTALEASVEGRIEHEKKRAFRHARRAAEKEFSSATGQSVEAAKEAEDRYSSLLLKNRELDQEIREADFLLTALYHILQPLYNSNGNPFSSSLIFDKAMEWQAFSEPPNIRLLNKLIAAFKTLSKVHEKNLEMVAYWLSSVFYFLRDAEQKIFSRTLSPFVIRHSSTKSVSVDSVDSFLSKLRSLLYDIFQLGLNRVYLQLEPVVVSQILEVESALFSPGTRGRKDMSIEPILTILSQTLLYVNEICLPQQIFVQFFTQIFYFINATLMNSLFCRSNLCNVSRGFQIKMALSQIFEWLSKFPTPSASIRQQLQGIEDVANVLTVDKSIFLDAGTAIETFPSLNLLQISHILHSITPDSVMPEMVDAVLLHSVDKLVKHSSETDSLMLDPFLFLEPSIAEE